MNARLLVVFFAIIASIAFSSIPSCSQKDTTPPQISQVIASGITGNSAIVSWVTDKPTAGQVEYGNTITYGSATPFETQPGNKHTIFLSGLSENTTYHYRVKSRDTAGNDSVSVDNVLDTKTTISVWIEHPKIKGFYLLRPRYWLNSFQPSADVMVLLADTEKCDGIEPQVSMVMKTFSRGTDTSIAVLIEKSKSVNKSNTKYEFVSEKQMVINGLSAGEIVWKVTDKNIEGEQWVFALHENNLFVFYCVAAQACWDSYKIVFDDIISSFKLVLK